MNKKDIENIDFDFTSEMWKETERLSWWNIFSVFKIEKLKSQCEERKEYLKQVSKEKRPELNKKEKSIASVSGILTGIIAFVSAENFAKRCNSDHEEILELIKKEINGKIINYVKNFFKDAIKENIPGSKFISDNSKKSNMLGFICSLLNQFIQKNSVGLVIYGETFQEKIFCGAANWLCNVYAQNSDMEEDNKILKTLKGSLGNILPLSFGIHLHKILEIGWKNGLRDTLETIKAKEIPALINEIIVMLGYIIFKFYEEFSKKPDLKNGIRTIDEMLYEIDWNNIYQGKKIERIMTVSAYIMSSIPALAGAGYAVAACLPPGSVNPVLLKKAAAQMYTVVKNGDRVFDDIADRFRELSEKTEVEILICVLETKKRRILTQYLYITAILAFVSALILLLLDLPIIFMIIKVKMFGI